MVCTALTFRKQRQEGLRGFKASLVYTVNSRPVKPHSEGQRWMCKILTVLIHGWWEQWVKKQSGDRGSLRAEDAEIKRGSRCGPQLLNLERVKKALS